jgi:flagellar protein FlaI
LISSKKDSKEKYKAFLKFKDWLKKQKKTEKDRKEMPRFIISQKPKLIDLPNTENIVKKGVIYPLIKPYANAYIKFDEIENTLIYNVMEPRLTKHETEMLEKVKEGMIQIIDVSFQNVKDFEKVFEFLEDKIQMLLREYGFEVKKEEYVKILYYIFRNFIGMNEIEPLLKDPYIEDIGCDGVGIHIYVIHQKYGSMKTNIIYKDEKNLRDFVIKLAERCDRYISYAEPLLDGTLPDGTRVHASLASDVTTRGPTFTLRKFKETPFTPIDMVNLGTASPEMLAYLWFVVENGANILITGGVATGKTSLLNCISMFIPTEAKIVSIEDTRELNLPHENWIPGVARTGFTGSGVGEVTMFELLKESFRQNPDYLIVGEVRGKEAYVLFQGMASGHPSMSTIHSGGVDDLIKRLETKPISLSAGLLNSLDIVITMVHAKEKGKSARRIKDIVEIENVDVQTGMARTNKSFAWIPSSDSYEYKGNSRILNKLATEKGIMMNSILKEIANRKKVIDWMLKNKIKKMQDVVKYVKMYKTNRESLENIISEGKQSVYKPGEPKTLQEEYKNLKEA